MPSTEEDMKKAMKAFKKRLKLTQLELMGEDVDLSGFYLAFKHKDLNIEEATVDINVERTIEGASTVTATVQGTSLSRSASQSYAVSQQPIQVTLAPVSNANVTNPLLSYTVDVCLPGAQSGYSFTRISRGTSPLTTT